MLLQNLFCKTLDIWETQKTILELHPNTTDHLFFTRHIFTFSNLKIPFFDYDFVKIGRFELALGNPAIDGKTTGTILEEALRFFWADRFLSGELLLMHLFINETMNESNNDRDDVVIDGVYWTKTIPFLEENQFVNYIFSILEIWIS